MALTSGTWGGIEYAIAATNTPVKLTTALGSTAGNADENHFRQIDFFNDSASVATIYLGKSTVTNTANRIAVVAKGTGYTIGPFPTPCICTDDIYVVGTQNDILHIAVTR